VLALPRDRGQLLLVRPVQLLLPGQLLPDGFLRLSRARRHGAAARCPGPCRGRDPLRGACPGSAGELTRPNLEPPPARPPSLCGEAGASTRTSHRTTTPSHTRSTARSSARPAVHHQPITRTQVRSVTPKTRQNVTRVAHTNPRTLTGTSRQVNGQRRTAPRGF